MRADLRSVMLLALTACSGAPAVSPPVPTPVAPSGAQVQAWLSMPDRSRLLEQMADLQPAGSDSAGATTIVIDTTQRFQSIIGFGAAITDASAELLQQGLAPAPRAALLRELFGRRDGEVGFTMVRVTIGSSDFSRTHETYDDMLPGARDDALASFSIASARINVLPVLQQARAINPQLTVTASPWSAPAWMKSSQSLIGGTLLPDAYPAFADYLIRYVSAFAEEGVPIAYLTVQNEPHYEPDSYPGMRFEPAQRAVFIGQHLGPRLVRQRVGTRILDWDHNWDAPQSPLAVLADTVARGYVTGVAWHCYGGEVSAQSQVHSAHPDMEVFFTECAGGDWAPNFGDNLRFNVRTLIIGTLRNWARGVTLWNLALDPSHGPHLGGCNDCRGVITIDPARGTVTRNEEFYALAHASRFVRPGAVRIASTSGVDGVDTVALRNADDGSVVLIATNSATTARKLSLRGSSGDVVRAILPAGAVATYVWR